MKQKNPLLILLILISFAVAPAFLLGDDNRNYFAIGVMFLSPLIILNYGKFKIDIWLQLFILSILFFPVIFNPESLRWSTIFYTLLFCSTYIGYKLLLQRGFLSLRLYEKTLRYLIYAYAITLFIQQLCVFFGVPIFNVSNYNSMFLWKLNALSSEPSHTARIIGLIMYSYLCLYEFSTNKKYDLIKNFRQAKTLWLSFFWIMLTMGSGTAPIFLIIILIKVVEFKNLAPLFFTIPILIFFLSYSNLDVFERTINTIEATITLDENQILKADHSAAMRIVPLIVITKMLDVSSIKGFFGHGIDYTSLILSDNIYGLTEGASGGGLLQIWLEYGFFSFILFLIFSLRVAFKQREKINLLLWFLLVFSFGINGQIVWLFLIMMETNFKFSKLSTLKS